MKIEIVEKVENPLLKRVEIKFKVNHVNAPTPKRLEVRHQLAEMLGTDEALVVIEKIASAYGRQVASGTARVYTSKERLEKIESICLFRRSQPKEKKPEKPPEEKKPEKAKQVEKEAKPKEKQEPEKEKQPEETKSEERKAENKDKEKLLKEGEKGGKEK